MAIRQRPYSKEELAQRGQALYDSSIRQQVEAGNEGKIVAGTQSVSRRQRHRRLLEADNFDRASRSLKTDIKFSKEVRLPKD